MLALELQRISTIEHLWLWVPASLRNCALGGDDGEWCATTTSSYCGSTFANRSSSA